MMNQVRKHLVQIISDDCFDYGDADAWYDQVDYQQYEHLVAEEFEVQPNHEIKQLVKEVVRNVHYNNR